MTLTNRSVRTDHDEDQLYHRECGGHIRAQEIEITPEDDILVEYSCSGCWETHTERLTRFQVVCSECDQLIYGDVLELDEIDAANDEAADHERNRPGHRAHVIAKPAPGTFPEFGYWLYLDDHQPEHGKMRRVEYRGEL